MLQFPSAQRAALSAIFAGSLLSLAGAAKADDVSANAPTQNVQVAEPSAGIGEPILQSEQTTIVTESSTKEPTFQAETRPNMWPNRPLLATGATVFGLSYLPAVAGAALSDADHRKDLYIPLAGPWMMLTRGERESSGEKTLLIVDGVAQGLGALMLISSLFIPERRTHRWYLIGSNETSVLPTRLGSGYGLGAAGRF